MADLSELQSTLPTKIAGASASGSETNFVNASTAGDIYTQDLLNSGGVYGNLTVTTTPVEIKVGGSKYTGRKLVTLDNKSSTTIYWGYNNSVSSTVYAGRIFKDQQAMWNASDAVSIWVVAASGSNTVAISEGA